MSFEIVKESIQRAYWYDINGKKEPDENSMLAKLLDENILFANSFAYAYSDGVLRGRTITLFVLCNDVFAWATADAEDITIEELPQLFEMYEKNPKCASTQWVCVKRNEKPQEPMIKWLKENNGWNETLEALPENNYDKFLKEKYNKEKNEL